MTEAQETRQVVDEPPPFLGTWGRVYVGVLLYLLGLIALFWAFGSAYTP